MMKKREKRKKIRISDNFFFLSFFVFVLSLFFLFLFSSFFFFSPATNFSFLGLSLFLPETSKFEAAVPTLTSGFGQGPTVVEDKRWLISGGVAKHRGSKDD